MPAGWDGVHGRGGIGTEALLREGASTSWRGLCPVAPEGGGGGHCAFGCFLALWSDTALCLVLRVTSERAGAIQSLYQASR